jgi:threonylcarbamoyladenosine tRNA methylthiotransferase MtaB
MTTFSVTTLGCKVNQYESEAIIEALRTAGWTLANGDSPVDIHIINTCTVTGKASMQSRQAIRQASRAHPGSRVIVTGCYAQTAPQEIRKIPGIHAVVGTEDKHRIPDMILSAPGLSLDGSDRVSDVRKLDRFGDAGITVTSKRTRPFLKIQDGCNAFCTYCIVPYARGRSRSMAPESVVAHVRRLEAAGHHEVVLTGIHLGLYGRDLAAPLDLAELVRRLLTATGIARIRLSSIEPRELTAELVEMTAASKRLCPHFHIPLQSGDDGILRRMHRPYSRTDFQKLVLSIRDRMPDAAIGVDTLIGFPGESPEAFENTRSLIEALPVTYLHVFPFSPRPGTPAADFPDPVAAVELKRRCSIMRALGQAKKAAFFSRFEGRTLTPLIESRRDPSTGLLKGVSANYIPVLMAGDDRLQNRLVNARIDRLQGQNAVRGTRLHPEPNAP